MPAIRDIQFNNNPTQTVTTVAINTPSHVEGDILIVIITADTYDGSGGFTTALNPAWTLIHQTTNTALQWMAWRVAGASEPGSYTFTSSDSETYTGCIVSIEDADTTNPFGNPAVRSTSNAAATAKVTMDTITTNVDNALILYAWSSSVAGVPSLLEGNVVSILAADGSAESLAVGWGFKGTIGTTADNVVGSAIASGAGVKTTLQIAPPTTGATKAPAYAASDLSLYINPINGTSAFNGDTAPALTADTNYGTSLGGFTAADASLAATADVGINSYHSVARLTSINNSINLAGMELVIGAANRPNLAGKNLLAHIGPSTEGQLQRFAAIPTTRGIWFGMRSNTGSGGATTGYKIWQVYGVEKGSLRHQPIVINPEAENTVATSGTLDPLVVTSIAWWVSGIGRGTTIWDVATVWALSTITIAGGVISDPVGVSGIALAAAIGKERKSVLLQGSTQLLSYQPIQFGDGGSSPIYLNLGATAIEFPAQFNRATKDVQYNSVDNLVGITYYAGANDTIIHTNASVSSSSRYHWRFHPGFVTTSTYDFSGLTIIGAGDIQLKSGLTLTEVSFNDYATINAAGVDFVECNFLEVPNTSTAITIDAGTSFDSCEINTTLLSSGTAWIQASDPSIFISCQFQGSTSTGHAIEITSTGTYDFSGNIFTGYGGVGGSNTVTNSGSTSAAIYNNSSGLVTLNILNGGTPPSVRNGASGTTLIVNNVTILISVTDVSTTPIVGAQVAVYTIDGDVELYNNQTDSNGESTFNYSASIPIYIRVRKSTTGSTRYRPLETTGNTGATGAQFSLTLVEDTFVELTL